MEKFSDIERKIEQRALRQVQTMLQSKNSLEKLDQIKENIETKKSNLEARLKTAVQSQLEGVKSGLEQLKAGRDQCVELQKSLSQVDQLFMNCMELGDWVQDMKDLSQEHSQLGAAMGNLRQLFKTPELIQESQRHIDNGNYLEAHSVLTDLEMSRDDLVFELHKNVNHSTSDEHMIIKYFSQVERMKVDNLQAAIRSEIEGMYEKVKTNPSKFVAALKVIEREEYLDKQYEKRKQTSGGRFKSCSRPYNWRNKTLEILHDMVDQRVGSPMQPPGSRNLSGESADRNPFDEDDGNFKRVNSGKDTGWIVQSLEQVRVTVLEDLLIIKQLCVPAFPPIYKIFDKLTHCYHMAVTTFVRGLLSHGLEGNEIVALLKFNKEYCSDQLMAHPQLKIDINKLPELIDKDLSTETVETYVESTREKVRKHLQAILEQEKREWYSETEPDVDGEGYYCTSFPNTMRKMVMDTMSVASEVDRETSKRIFKEILLEILRFIQDLREAVEDLVGEHKQARDTPPRFLEYMISISNNCYGLVKHVESMCMKMGVDLADVDENRIHNTELDEATLDEMYFFGRDCRIHEELADLAQQAVDYLLQEVFLDLQGFFDKIMTVEDWLDTELNYGPVDTINATIEDYSNDFVNIRPILFNLLVKKCEEQIAIEYLNAIFSRKMKDCDAIVVSQMGERMEREADQLERFISLLLANNNDGTHETSWEIRPLESVKMSADILRCSKEMMNLDIQTIMNRFKGCQGKHIKELLLLRNDLNKTDIAEMIEPFGDKNLAPHKLKAGVPSVFHNVTLQTGWFG